MVDERALEVVKEMLLERHGELRHLFNYDDFAPRLIEAYEAAKWRPIEEVKLDESEILIAREHGGIMEYCVLYATADLHEEPYLTGAMFRTIDPPPQNAVSRAISTPPAAEASDRFISVHDEISSPDTRRMDQETPRSKS